jgi:aspartate/methionine/tyrosine aminotransferase
MTFTASQPARIASMDTPDYLEPGEPDTAQRDRELGQIPRAPGGMDFTHGDPVAFPPPDWALPTVVKSIEDGRSAYSPYRGHDEVRDRMSTGLGRLLGLPSVDGGSEVIVTPGTQAGLFAALSSLVGPGDAVMVADPDYFASQRIVRYLGGTVIPIPLVVSDEGFARLDLDRVRAALPERPVALLFSNPNNPTGSLVEQRCIDELAELLAGTDTSVVVDELYCRLVYDDLQLAHLAARPAMRERCITLVGPSKTESMSGYRLGAAVGPAHLVERMEAVLSVVALRAPGYNQPLLSSWLDGDEDWLRERTLAHAELRDLVVSAFRGTPGVRVSLPRGGSYVFPDVSDLGLSGFEAAAHLRREHGILVNPGYQFGLRGHGSFRMNYSQDRAGLVRALACITDSLRTMAR